MPYFTTLFFPVNKELELFSDSLGVSSYKRSLININKIIKFDSPPTSIDTNICFAKLNFASSKIKLNLSYFIY